jgi:hypothetical protein
MALIGLTAFKSSFPNKVQTSDESNVNAIILAAQSIAERYMERTLFLNATKTVYLDVNGNKLLLPDAPINSVGNVYYDQARAFSTALDSAQYYAETNDGKIILNGTYYGEKVFKVIYSVGWAEDTAPETIETIVKEIAYYIWKRQSKDQIGSRELTGAEGYRLVYDPSFPKFVKDMMDMERRY